MSWYEQRGNYNVTGYLGTKRQRGEHGRWTPVFVAAEREDDRRMSLAYPAHYHIMPRFSFDGDVFLGTMLTNAQDANPSTPSTLTVSGTTPFKLESCDARDVSPFDRIYVCRVDGKRVTMPGLSLDSDIHRDAIQVSSLAYAHIYIYMYAREHSRSASILHQSTPALPKRTTLMSCWINLLRSG